jgi:hypothetical protein
MGDVRVEIPGLPRDRFRGNLGRQADVAFAARRPIRPRAAAKCHTDAVVSVTVPADAYCRQHAPGAR